jgi:hypothetical protein
MGEYLIDSLFAGIKNLLPSKIKPHAEKIVFGFIALIIYAIFAWECGITSVAALVLGSLIVFILVGIIGVIIDKIKNRGN